MVLLFFTDVVAGLSPVASVSVAYASAMLIYFLICKAFVFSHNHQAPAGKQLLQFGVVVTINFFLTQIIVNAMHRFTGEVFSGSVVSGIVTITLSYFIFNRLVFTTPGKEDS